MATQKVVLVTDGHASQTKAANVQTVMEVTQTDAPTAVQLLNANQWNATDAIADHLNTNAFGCKLQAKTEGGRVPILTVGLQPCQKLTNLKHTGMHAVRIDLDGDVHQTGWIAGDYAKSISTSFEFRRFSPSSRLTIEVWHKRTIRENKMIGWVLWPISNLVEDSMMRFKGWIALNYKDVGGGNLLVENCNCKKKIDISSKAEIWLRYFEEPQQSSTVGQLSSHSFQSYQHSYHEQAPQTIQTSQASNESKSMLGSTCRFSDSIKRQPAANQKERPAKECDKEMRTQNLPLESETSLDNFFGTSEPFDDVDEYDLSALDSELFGCSKSGENSRHDSRKQPDTCNTEDADHDISILSESIIDQSANNSESQQQQLLQRQISAISSEDGSQSIIKSTLPYDAWDSTKWTDQTSNNDSDNFVRCAPSIVHPQVSSKGSAHETNFVKKHAKYQPAVQLPSDTETLNE